MVKSKEPPTPKTPHPVTSGPWRHVIARMQDPKAHYPRFPTPANIWRRTPQAKAAIQAETKRRAEAEYSNTPQAQAQGKIFVLREAVVRDLFDSLGEEEKKRWKIKTEEEHGRKVREWEDLVKPSEDPKVRQMYIDGLADFVKAYFKVLSKATGCAVSFIGGGPEPAMGGRLNVVGVHQGHIPDHPELNFAKFDPEAYKEKVVKPFGRLLRRCYTKEDGKAMALPIDPHSQTQPGSVLQSAIEPSIDITVGPIDFDDPAYEDNEEDWGETWDVEEGFTGENAKMNMLINSMHIEEVFDDEDEDGGGEAGDSMFSRYIISFPEMEGAGASASSSPSPSPSIIPDHVSGTSLENPTPTPSASASANSQTSSSSSSPVGVAVPTSAVPHVPASASALDNPSNPNPNLNSISAPSLSPSPQPQPAPVPVISPPTPNPDVDMSINVGVGVDMEMEMEMEMDVDIDVDANMDIDMDINIPTSNLIASVPAPAPGPALEPELELEDPSNSQRKVGPLVQVQSAGGGGGGSSSLQGEARSATAAAAAASTSESTTPAPDAAPVTVSPTPSLPSSSPASSLAVGSGGGTGQVNSSPSPSPNSNSKSNGQKEGSSPARTQSQTLQSSPSSSSPASGAGGSDSPGAVALVLAPAAGSSNLTSTLKSTAPSNSAASSPAPSSATKPKPKPKPRPKAKTKMLTTRRGDSFSFLFPSSVASSSEVTLDWPHRGSTTTGSTLCSKANVSKYTNTSTTSPYPSASSPSFTSPSPTTPASRPTINGWPDYGTDENGNPRGLRITEEYLNDSASKFSIGFDDPDEPLIPHILITAPSPSRNTNTAASTSAVPNARPPPSLPPPSPRSSPSPLDVLHPIFRLINPAPRQIISDKDRLAVPPRSYKRKPKAKAVLPPTPTSSPVTTGTGARASTSTSATAQMPSGGAAVAGSGGEKQKGGDCSAHSPTPSQTTLVSEQKAEAEAKAPQALDPKVIVSRLIDKAAETLKAMAANSKSKSNPSWSNSSATALPSRISAPAPTASAASASNGSGVSATPVSAPDPTTSPYFGDVAPSVDKSPTTVSTEVQEELASYRSDHIAVRSTTAPNMVIDDRDEVLQPEPVMDVDVGNQPSQSAGDNFVDSHVPQDLSRGINSPPENIKAPPAQPPQPETQQRSSLREGAPKATSEDEFFQDDIPIDADTFSYFASLSKVGEARVKSHLPSNSMDVEMAVEEDGSHDSATLQLDEDEGDEDRRKDKSSVRRSKRKRASSIITAPVKVATAGKETRSSSTRSSKRLRLSNQSMSISAPLPRSSKSIKRSRPSTGPSATPAVSDMTTPPIPEADPTAPQYFKNAIQMFTSPDQESFGPRWTSLVSMWSSFEVNASYEEVRGLGKAHRPQVIGDWISRARSATWRPNITIGDPDLRKFEAQFRRWWVSLQPEWRVLNVGKSELVKEMNEKDDSGSFDELRLPGKNGVVSVLAALFYWGLAVKGKNPKSKARQKWLEAVEDCHWVFEQLVRPSV